MNDVVRFESVQNKIIVLRGKEVILDFAVAELYGVETKRINEAVKNNPEKFPDGYVIQLDKDEASFLRSKISTLEMKPLVRVNIPSITIRHLPRRGYICLPLF